MADLLSVPNNQQQQRRRSSLESVPLVGNYFYKKREDKQYFSFAVKHMTTLTLIFQNLDMKPYEIAYFIKLFKLPIKSLVAKNSTVKPTEISKTEFLKNWEAAISALAEEASDSAPVAPSDAIYGYREKKALREDIGEGLCPSLLYAMQELKDKDTFVTKFSDADSYDNSPSGGVFLDITLLHFLAIYYKSLKIHAEHHFHLHSEASTPVPPVALPPIEDSLPNVRITPGLRCFNFQGTVSTYGEVNSKRNPNLLKDRYETSLVPMSPEEQDLDNEGIKTTTGGVLTEGAFRKPQDLWRYI